MRSLRAFWWSPRRSPELLLKEMRAGRRAWAAMAARTARPFVNFGDELTPVALAMASGRRVTWAPPNKADVLASGSILDFYADEKGSGGAIIWGTGLRHDPGSAERAGFIRSRLGTVLAVRGPLTRAALDLPADTKVADPGVLAGELVRRPRRRRGTGLLPHFRTWATAEGRLSVARAKSDDIHVIVPSDKVTRVLDQIAAVDFLYTSSLHGLVCAHALGVPVQWIGIPGIGTWEEPDFKYRDYLASVGSQMEPVSLRGGTHALAEAVEARNAETERLRDASGELATRLLRSWT